MRGDDPAEGAPGETARASPAAYDPFVDDFDAPELDVRHWLPHYLHWYRVAFLGRVSGRGETSGDRTAP